MEREEGTPDAAPERPAHGEKGVILPGETSEQTPGRTLVPVWPLCLRNSAKHRRGPRWSCTQAGADVCTWAGVDLCTQRLFS